METFEAGQITELELLGGDGTALVRTVLRAEVGGEYVMAVVGTDQSLYGVQPGARIRVLFNNRFGKHQAHSCIISVAVGDEVMLTISALESLQTIQRRAYFRVAAFLPIEISVVHSSLNDMYLRHDRRASTLDISAGGLLIDTVLGPALEDVLALVLAIPPELRYNLPDVLACKAHVVRSESSGFSGYRVGVQSHFPREIERDKWVQLTLNIQQGKI